MLIVNCGFSRKTRKPHRRSRIQCKNVTGIELDMNVTDASHLIREELMKHAPKGKGWSIAGYAFVNKGRS